MRHPTNGTMPSCDMLEILIAHGWDINSRRPESSGIPLLWRIVRDYSRVRWCLDHGADVDPPDDTPPNQARMRKPILESAAANGNILTFELLQERGAPLEYDYDVLSVAVMSANGLAPRNGDEPNIYYKMQLDMVRYLINVVKCDVNSESYGAHYASGSSCSTPLCWLVCNPIGDAREPIWLLLDRGGDVSLQGPSYEHYSIPSALDAGTESHDKRFLEAVKEWQALQQDNTGVCSEEGQ